MPEQNTLKLLLEWIIGGAAGTVAFGLWEWFESMFDRLKEIPSKWERVITLSGTALLAAGAFVAYVYAGYGEIPSTPIQWIESIVAVVLTAITAAVGGHTLKMLFKRER